MLWLRISALNLQSTTYSLSEVRSDSHIFLLRDWRNHSLVDYLLGGALLVMDICYEEQIK